MKRISSPAEAKEEIICDFIGEKLFGDDIKSLERMMSSMSGEQRSKFKQFVDGIFEKLKQVFRLGKDRKYRNEVERLEQRWVQCFQNSMKNYEENVNENLLDASIKKAPNWFSSRGLQLPKLVQTILDANNTIPTSSQKVNRNLEEKFSDARNSTDAEARNDVKHSVEYTIDNIPIAVVEEDILKGVSKNEWIQKVKKVMSDNFNAGIPIKGKLIKVNSISKSEYTNSKYSRYLKSEDGTIYADKFKSVNNLDDIILATTNYINEDLKHNRNDNIKEFARGNALIRVGKNDYSANVIVGFTNSKSMVLYDIIDFKRANFDIKRKHPMYRLCKKQEAKEMRYFPRNIICRIPKMSTKIFRKILPMFVTRRMRNLIKRI